MKKPLEEFSDIIKLLRSKRVTDRMIHETLLKKFSPAIGKSYTWICKFLGNPDSLSKQKRELVPDLLLTIKHNFNNQLQENDDKFLIGDFNIYFSGTSILRKGIQSNAEYKLIANGKKVFIKPLDQTISRSSYVGTISAELNGNLFFEFDEDGDSKEKIYWICRKGNDKTLNYIPGLYLTLDEDYFPVVGPVLLVRKNIQLEEEKLASYFAHFKMTSSDLIHGISLINNSHISESIIQYKKLLGLVGIWKVMRWNDAMKKYSIYRLEINKKLDVICTTATNNIFSCNIKIIGKNRIIIEGLNQSEEIFQIFIANINGHDSWLDIEKIYGSYQRISPDHTRYGDCMFYRMGNESINFLPAQIDSSKLNKKEEKEMAKYLVERSFQTIKLE